MEIESGIKGLRCRALSTDSFSFDDIIYNNEAICYRC
jgi:hypothetical protein